MDLIRKMPPHARVLGGGVTHFHGILARRTGCATDGGKKLSVNFEAGLVSVERMDEIRQPEPALLAADVRPLLLGGQKRGVEFRRDPAGIKQLSREFSR